MQSITTVVAGIMKMITKCFDYGMSQSNENNRENDLIPIHLRTASAKLIRYYTNFHYENQFSFISKHN